MRVSYVGLHAWEEPCLSGDRGSGTIFFSGCSLGCAFCQNADISRSWTGELLDPAGLARHMLALQALGAHNINLVTGAHVLTSAAVAIRLAKAQGLSLPVVWNTGAYEKAEALRMLEGLVDIYLPDLKYEDPLLSLALCNAENYASVAHAALYEMHRQTGTYENMENGLLVHGMIVRHLVLPGCIRDSFRVLEWLAANLPMDIRLSILAQYTPMPHMHIIAEENLSKALQRTITTFEYQKVLDKAMSLGFTRILTQERASAGQRYIPPFSRGSGSGE
ncbi:MAG TPA: radical SAM protein [Clostridia bacterium]